MMYRGKTPKRKPESCNHLRISSTSVKISDAISDNNGILFYTKHWKN
jgi:hypothetical protein